MRRSFLAVIVATVLAPAVFAACGSGAEVLAPGIAPGVEATETSSPDGAAPSPDASAASLPDGSTPDGGGDASTPPADLGEPIVVPPTDFEKWVWVPIPEMHCADGSPAGIAANFTDKSRDLVIFFQGGGACWNAITCAAQGDSLKPVGADLDEWMPESDGRSGIFDRTDTSNPYTKSNFVYVPYCTGDGHLGSKTSNSYGKRHVGYMNATEATKRIVPTFRDAPRVVVAGFSAGGIGASVNFHQIAAAFESVGTPVLTLINDSGPFLRTPYLKTSTENTLRSAWNVDASLGSWCPTCGTVGVHDVYRRTAELHPGMRGALVSSYSDGVVRLLYFALGSPLEGGNLKKGLADLAKWEDTIEPTIAPSQWRQFFYTGDRHGAIEAPLKNTPGLSKFLTDQLGGGTWTSVKP